jgi:hypothetical protein
MSPSRPIILVVASLAAAAACKTSGPRPVEPAPSPSPQTVAAPQPSTAPAGIDAGPAASGDRAAREQAVFQLLAGEVDSDSLPEVATEPGVPLDHDLLERLAPAGSK